MNKSFLYADVFPPDILAFTTTKYGGFGSGVYGSFNTGIFTGGDKIDILKNIEYLKSCNNISRLALLKQVHGSRVAAVGKDGFAEAYLSEGDGLFTGETDIALGIFTADCFPVLLAGKECIAALHCGWRSLNSGIIENALEHFRKNGDFPRRAYVGPGICSGCYEIKDDMIRKLDARYEPERAIIAEKNGGYKLDLKMLVENALKINKINDCRTSKETSCCSGMFYSYRKDGTTGRMLSVIMRRQN